MRNLLTIAVACVVVATSGCPQPSSYPGDACDEYEPCVGDLTCIGFRCIANCRYEGDCDQGYRCHDGSCIASCEEQADCDEFGTCSGLGPGRRGSACLLIGLPQCSGDWHCGGDICVDAYCQTYCDAYRPCPSWQRCEPVDEYRGYCANRHFE